MNGNQQLIQHFYTAFQNKDYGAMQACYAENATFSDPVFQNLDSVQAGKMWEMLLKKGKDLVLEFSNVQANEKEGSADWQATYTFSATKRKVVNHIHANFVFENGKIVHHQDHFNFYKWARQALGFPGLMFGWTGFLQESVRQKAMGNLTAFIRE